MSGIGLFDRTTALLGRVLDLRVRSQEVIASNISNAQTPGYTPVRLEFEGEMQQALKHVPGEVAATHPSHIGGGSAQISQVQGRVVSQQGKSGIGDENGVSLDDEMIAMAENQLLYEAATQMINKKLGMLKYVARDGK